VFTALSALSAIGAAVGTVLCVIGIAASAMTTVASVSGIAFAVLCAAYAWQRWTPFLPEPAQRLANFIQSIVTSVFSIITLGVILPIDLEQKDPKSPQGCIPNQTPILMIHGFCGSSNNWVYHKQRLQGAGYQNLFTINLGSPFHSIGEYTSLVQQKIEDIKRITRQNEVILIGHSMGGLVSRAYRYAYAERQQMNVRKIITLGTPLDGTYMAYLASWVSGAAQEMEPGSPFVRGQQGQACLDDATEYFHIGSRVDSIVIPNSSALEGKGRRVKTETLNATGHIELLFSDEAADLIIDELKSSSSL
jgi:triacylglycerol esterase/lipase EstA (alpha/beta hydrolase family)